MERHGYPTDDSEYAEMLRALIEALDRTLDHGFGEFTVTCETGKNKRREVLLQHGLSEKYIIQPEELRD